jgi:hypothetical protein
MKVNNVIGIPASLKGDFFRKWVEYLTPLHNLANREKDVLAAFIKARFELQESILDLAWLDMAVMSDETRNKIKDELGISSSFFKVILSNLRKQGVIVDGKLNPKYIPKGIKTGDKTFQLLLYFDLDEGHNK